MSEKILVTAEAIAEGMDPFKETAFVVEEVKRNKNGTAKGTLYTFRNRDTGDPLLIQFPPTPVVDVEKYVRGLTVGGEKSRTATLLSLALLQSSKNPAVNQSAKDWVAALQVVVEAAVRKYYHALHSSAPDLATVECKKQEIMSALLHSGRKSYPWLEFWDTRTVDSPMQELVTFQGQCAPREVRPSEPADGNLLYVVLAFDGLMVDENGPVQAKFKVAGAYWILRTKVDIPKDVQMNPPMDPSGSTTRALLGL